MLSALPLVKIISIFVGFASINRGFVSNTAKSMRGNPEHHHEYTPSRALSSHAALLSIYLTNQSLPNNKTSVVTFAGLATIPRCHAGLWQIAMKLRPMASLVRSTRFRHVLFPCPVAARRGARTRSYPPRSAPPCRREAVAKRCLPDARERSFRNAATKTAVEDARGTLPKVK